jgi:hypothetical protein
VAQAKKLDVSVLFLREHQQAAGSVVSSKKNKNSPKLCETLNLQPLRPMRAARPTLKAGTMSSCSFEESVLRAIAASTCARKSWDLEERQTERPSRRR